MLHPSLNWSPCSDVIVCLVAQEGIDELSGELLQHLQLRQREVFLLFHRVLVLRVLLRHPWMLHLVLVPSHCCIPRRGTFSFSAYSLSWC